MPTEPTEDIVILPSVIAFHVVPPSVVFQAPPPVAPNQYSFGRASLPSAAIDRPPLAGPTFRHRMPPYKFGSTVEVAEPPCCAATGTIDAKAPTITRSRMDLMGQYSTLLTY